MDKQATVRSVRASYKIDQVENGWTVTTNDGTVFVFADAIEVAAWFCMIVGVPFEPKKKEQDPLEEELRKLTRAYAQLANDDDQVFVSSSR